MAQIYGTSPAGLDQIVGESASIGKVRQRILQVSDGRFHVLIEGPSGTGKELVARAIHAQSSRSSKPFIPVNCAALPADLFASQLFGHVKGAFTGASSDSLGCFRAADGGTLFLDEIGELDLDLQAKLLRALQERKVYPVGSHDGIPLNVRIVAATNRDLESEVESGRFRLDLFYRLNVVSISTPALSERTEDIPLLARHFLAKASLENGLPAVQLSPAALTLLGEYHWPGNIRELENAIERAVVFADSTLLGPECFPQIRDAVARRAAAAGRTRESDHTAKLAFSVGNVPATGADPEAENMSIVRFPSAMVRAPLGDGANDAHSDDDFAPAASPLEGEHGWLSLADVERDHIRRTLKQTGFNQSAAARLLGIDRKLLARKIRKYGLRVPAALARRPGM